ncbi:MAG: STAS domain-containing protein [Clostridiales bacterium]|nr:STAS domain-containing protein [Clostridiales bacterium]
MEVTSCFNNGKLYITLCGEMDEYSASSARIKCDNLIDSYVNAKKIIINLARVAFMDSTGIGFLIGRYKKASRLNIPLFVAQPDFAADKILNLSGIYSLIPKAE